MKTYLIALYLLASGGFANASIQVVASQDKPARLFVKIYNLHENSHRNFFETNYFYTGSGFQTNI